MLVEKEWDGHLPCVRAASCPAQNDPFLHHGPWRAGLLAQSLLVPAVLVKVCLCHCAQCGTLRHGWGSGGRAWGAPGDVCHSSLEPAVASFPAPGQAVHSSRARLLPERAGASTVLHICSWLCVRPAMGIHLLNRDEAGCSWLLQQQLNQKSL